MMDFIETRERISLTLLSMVMSSIVIEIIIFTIDEEYSNECF
jgi:hypothetical protein